MIWRTPILYLLQHYDAEPIVNIGWGEDVTIKELAELVLSVIGYTGRLEFDTTKPDGTPRKLLDVTRLTELGWRPKIPLKLGIEDTYAWFTEHFERGQTLEDSGSVNGEACGTLIELTQSKLSSRRHKFCTLEQRKSRLPRSWRCEVRAEAGDVHVSGRLTLGSKDLKSTGDLRSAYG